MPYSPEIYQSAALLLEKRRDEAERSAEKRRSEVYSAVPEISEADAELSKELSGLSSAMLRKGADTVSVTNEIRLCCERMKARRAELLIKNGYPADYLEPAYTCLKCSDSCRVG